MSAPPSTDNPPADGGAASHLRLPGGLVLNAPLLQRLSAAAHARLPHANPLSTEQIVSLAEDLADRSPATALDVGCGPGSLSVRLASRCGAEVLGVDINPHFLERALAEAARAPLRGRIEFELRPASELDAERQFDAVMCVGSSQAFGSTVQALAQCVRVASPGGCVLFADLIWIAEPDPDFLSFLGVESSAYWTPGAAEQCFRQAGLRLLRTETASAESWETYERGVLQGRLAFADTLREFEAAVVRERATAWFRAYTRYGRRCLGFSGYVLAK